jgi:hypothetical protein
MFLDDVNVVANVTYLTVPIVIEPGDSQPATINAFLFELSLPVSSLRAGACSGSICDGSGALPSPPD